MNLRDARRALDAAALVLCALYVGTQAVALASHAVFGVQMMVPAKMGLAALGALALFALGQALEILRRRGFARLWPLLALVTASVPGLMVLGLISLFQLRSELDRVTLPDGRQVLLTLEPIPTDAVYALWETAGWGWRPVLQSVSEITYSEDGSFTKDPALILTPDGAHLLIRRGGIWADCVVVAKPWRTCIEMDGSPDTPREMHARSSAIAAYTGVPADPR